MDRNLSEPGGGGDNPEKQSVTGNRGKKKMRDDTDGAGKKPKKQRGGDGESSREVEETTRRVKDLVGKIDPDLKELTKDELSSFMRILGHRNSRKQTRAEKDGYKSLGEETNKCFKDIRERLNGMKADNEMFRDEMKAMEAKIECLQNQKMAKGDACNTMVEETNKCVKEILGMQNVCKAQMGKFQSENQAMWTKCEELQKEMEWHRKLIADHQIQRQLEEIIAQDPGLKKMIADNQMPQAAGMSPYVTNNLVQGTPRAWGPIASTPYTPPVMNSGSREFGGIQAVNMRELGLENCQTSNTTFDAGASTSTAAPLSIEDIEFWFRDV